MNPDILLTQLYEYGIRGVSNYRNQKCFVNGHLSNNCSLSCSIPQGTILGPPKLPFPLSASYICIHILITPIVLTFIQIKIWFIAGFPRARQLITEKVVVNTIYFYSERQWCAIYSRLRYSILQIFRVKVLTNRRAPFTKARFSKQMGL